jgi:hypothetical protein
MIPLSIERTEVSSYNYFFNEKKMLILIANFILNAVITFLLVKFLSSGVAGGMTMGLLIGAVTTIVSYFYIIRFVVFEEKRQRRLFKSLQDERISPYSSFWNISKIDNAGNTRGMIHYKPDGDTIKKAIVIKVTRGSIVARNEKFYSYYHQTIAQFMRDLLGEGYRVRQYSLAEFGNIPENLQYLIDKANAITDPKIRQISVMYTDNLLSKVKHAKAIEVDYFMIYCTQYFRMRDFYATAYGIMLKNFESNFFKDKKILDQPGVMQFFAQILQVNAFPIINQESTVPFAEYGEIVRAFDGSNNELFIEQLESEVTEGPDQYEEEDDIEVVPEKVQSEPRISRTYDIGFNKATNDSIKEKTDEINLVRMVQEQENPIEEDEEEDNLIRIFDRKKGDESK